MHTLNVFLQSAQPSFRFLWFDGTVMPMGGLEAVCPFAAGALSVPSHFGEQSFQTDTHAFEQSASGGVGILFDGAGGA